MICKNKDNLVCEKELDRVYNETSNKPNVVRRTQKITTKGFTFETAFKHVMSKWGSAGDDEN